MAKVVQNVGDTPFKFTSRLGCVMYRSLGNDVTLAAPEYVSIGRTTGAMYSLARYQQLNALSEWLGAHKCYTISPSHLWTKV